MEMLSTQIVKITLLLTPVYVTLFWGILLLFISKETNPAKRFLGIFMFNCVILYTGHLLFFIKLTPVVRWFEPFYQGASLLSYPLFHIYFCLLFKDASFQLRKHGIFFILPAAYIALYAYCAYSLPGDAFVTWLYDRDSPSETWNVHVLKVLDVVFRILLIGQVLVTVLRNNRIIHHHQRSAINYLSDIVEVRTQRTVLLNLIVLICAISSIVLCALGRLFFTHELTGLAIASVLFSTAFFTIGWLGFEQKVVPPTLLEPDPISSSEKTLPPTSEDIPTDSKRELLHRMKQVFEKEHIHLESKLTIQDVALKVGTNRTYISSLINQHYGVTFCSFVNNLRVEEMERMMKENPKATNQMLAEACGFGSVDSLKRAVQSKTGLSISAWKRQHTSAEITGQETR